MAEAPVAAAMGPQPLLASTNTGTGKAVRSARPVHAFSTVAIAFKVGIGGFGADIATPLTQTLNFRVGGSFFSYAGNFTEDGLQIAGDVKFRSATASLDWFPFHGGFHISPGVTIYNGNNLNASVQVPGGQQFSLGDAEYTSSVTDPVHGVGSLTFGKRTAPNVTVGWGNMIPRSGKHFTFPFEIGFEYIGTPLVTFNLAGTACGPDGCGPIATDPTTQANLQAEQNELNSDISPLRFYPIVSMGFAYKF